MPLAEVAVQDKLSSAGKEKVTASSGQPLCIVVVFPNELKQL